MSPLDLPARFEMVAVYRGDQSALRKWTDGLSDPPACVRTVMGAVETHVQGVAPGIGASVNVFHGAFERDYVENCLSEFGAYLHDVWAVTRSGQITVVTGTLGSPMYVAWLPDGRVAWHDDRAVVEEVLANRTSLRSNDTISALSRRVDPTSPVWAVGTVNISDRVTGVPARGFFVSGDLSPSAPPSLSATFVYPSTVEAGRAVANLAAAARDERFSASAKHSFEAMRAAQSGVDVTVDLMPILRSPVALREVSELAQATLDAR